MAKIYLDRSVVLKKVGYIARSWGIFEGVREKLADTIKAIPAADVAPVVHGHWIAHGDCGVTECSCCKETVAEYVEDDFCRYCGARMDGEEGEAKE